MFVLLQRLQNSYLFWILDQLFILKKQTKKTQHKDFLFSALPLCSLQDQTARVDRINKETGELSASGELPVLVEELKVEGSCRNPQLAQVLRERLQELGIHTYATSDHRTDHEPLEQKEERLAKVLPLYIQVWTCGAAVCTCFFSHCCLFSCLFSIGNEIIFFSVV